LIDAHLGLLHRPVHMIVVLERIGFVGNRAKRRRALRIEIMPRLVRRHKSVDRLLRPGRDRLKRMCQDIAIHTDHQGQ